MKMKLYESFMLICIITIVKSNFPLHCESDNIVGEWKLYFTNFYQIEKNDEITCSNNDTLNDKINSKISLDILDYKTVSLNNDFTALLKDSRKYYLGKWNIIGDQGLMIKFVEYEMITFFKFKLNTKIENIYNDITSFCYKTLPGISTFTSNKITKKACFYGEKIVRNVNEEFIFKDTETYINYYDLLTNNKCFDYKKLLINNSIKADKIIAMVKDKVKRTNINESNSVLKIKKNENKILQRILDNIEVSKKEESLNLNQLNKQFLRSKNHNDSNIGFDNNNKSDLNLNYSSKIHSTLNSSNINNRFNSNDLDWHHKNRKIEKENQNSNNEKSKSDNIDEAKEKKSIRMEKLNYLYLIDSIIFNDEVGKSHINKYYIETNSNYYSCNINYSNVTSILLMLSMRLKFMYNLSKKFSINHANECNYLTINGISTHPIFTLYFLNENYLKIESNEEIIRNIDSKDILLNNKKSNCNLIANKSLLKDYHEIDDYGQIASNTISIEEELISKGPVVCGIQITNDFYKLVLNNNKNNAELLLQNILKEATSWKKEGREQPFYSRSQLYVVIIGFNYFIDNNSKKVPYWIVLNPFYNGESNSIFELFIPKGYDYFRIESDCVYGNLKPPN